MRALGLNDERRQRIKAAVGGAEERLLGGVTLNPELASMRPSPVDTPHPGHHSVVP
jgi:hypothetical protein